MLRYNITGYFSHSDVGTDKQVIIFASDKGVALVYIGQKKMEDNTTEVRELSLAAPPFPSSICKTSFLALSTVRLNFCSQLFSFTLHENLHGNTVHTSCAF
jgi:hypothetical protein